MTHDLNRINCWQSIAAQSKQLRFASQLTVKAPITVNEYMAEIDRVTNKFTYIFDIIIMQIT